MTETPPERPNPYQVELLLAAALARITDRQTAAITTAWARGWSEISADLLEAVEVVLARDGRVLPAAVVRYERLTRVLAAIADVLEDLSLMVGMTITEDLAEVLDLAEQGTQELVAAQLVDRDQFWTPRPVAPDALTAIVRRTTKQVTSTTLPLADETYSVILRELTRGVAAGDSPRDTAARMVERSRNHWNFGEARALNIARTETIDAYREAATVSQETNSDVVAGWVWLAHLGPRTCRSCLAMHGEFFELSVSGPIDHQQGRCSRTPVVAEEDGSFDLSWVPDAIDHLTSLPVEDQQAILGREGHRAWLEGRFPPELWYTRRQNPGWRDSIVPASPPSPEEWRRLTGD